MCDQPRLLCLVVPDLGQDKRLLGVSTVALGAVLAGLEPEEMLTLALDGGRFGPLLEEPVSSMSSRASDSSLCPASYHNCCSTS